MNTPAQMGPAYGGITSNDSCRPAPLYKADRTCIRQIAPGWAHLGGADYGVCFPSRRRVPARDGLGNDLYELFRLINHGDMPGIDKSHMFGLGQTLACGGRLGKR